MSGVVESFGLVKNSTMANVEVQTPDNEPESGCRIMVSPFQPFLPTALPMSDAKRTYEIKCSLGKMSSITVDSPCTPHEAVREFLFKHYPSVMFRGALILESEGKWTVNLKDLQLKVYESTWVPPSRR